MAFNSPVWFNVGVQPKPQCSACFINSVQDNMESIMDLAKTEGMLFKWGSGTGTNFSSLRGSRETLSGGGIASGPVSFMKGFDAFAGVIKSGGKTRRAAKMVILNVDHPDIVEFIDCKMKEERKAHVLIEQGYDPAIDGEAYCSVFFQNANHSVRVTDEFMQAVEDDRDWWTRNVNDGKPVEKFSARELLAPHGRIRLALRRSRHAVRHHDQPLAHLQEHGAHQRLESLLRIHVPRRHGVQPGVAQPDEVLGRATATSTSKPSATPWTSPSRRRKSWWTTPAIPTPRIAENSHNFRPLGLGYANLGALLMSMALPYDSDGGRDMAGAVTALMCGEAYAQSARIAERLGPFPGYAANREPMLDVIRMHRDSLRPIKPENVQPSLLGAAQNSWDTALALGEKYGYKNSQVTVLAPTGTIGFMMDCDTTGIEPDLALVKYKKLVGGGVIKIVNNTVPQALMQLGYSPEETSQIVSYIDRNGTIEGAPGSQARASAGFRLLARAARGGRSIAWRGHLKMMAAAQPFLSGAISKTINMPEESTIEDIMQAYIESWKLGLKAVAIYRDNSKGSQPLSAAGDKKDTAQQAQSRRAAAKAAEPRRQSPSSSELFVRSRTPQDAQRAPVHHAQILHRRPRRLHHRRHVRRPASPAKSSSRWPRKARRFPASWTASRFRFPSACNTACRSRRWSTNSSTRASSPPATPAIRRFRTPSPCSITSRAGSAAGLFRPTISRTTAMPRCPQQPWPPRPPCLLHSSRRPTTIRHRRAALR